MPKYVICAFPKSGTHLAAAILERDRGCKRTHRTLFSADNWGQYVDPSKPVKDGKWNTIEFKGDPNILVQDREIITCHAGPKIYPLLKDFYIIYVQRDFKSCVLSYISWLDWLEKSSLPFIDRLINFLNFRGYYFYLNYKKLLGWRQVANEIWEFDKIRSLGADLQTPTKTNTPTPKWPEYPEVRAALVQILEEYYAGCRETVTREHNLLTND